MSVTQNIATFSLYFCLYLHKICREIVTDFRKKTTKQLTSLPFSETSLAYTVGA
jgi:hypothetical protein